MKFDKENFIKEYNKYLQTLTIETLSDSSYNYTSSTYLFIQFIGKSVEFQKKYFKKTGVPDEYKNDENLKEIISQLNSFATSIVLNHFYNIFDFKTKRTIKYNFFEGLQNDNHSDKFNQNLISECNNFLLADKLKVSDIYTLRKNAIENLNIKNSTKNKKEKLLIEIKIDKIFEESLRIFEIENKNYKQLYDYISIRNKDNSNDYIMFVEKEFKTNLLPLILESKINETLVLFNEKINKFKVENSYFPVINLESDVIKRLNKKHIEININPDEFDI